MALGEMICILKFLPESSSWLEVRRPGERVEIAEGVANRPEGRTRDVRGETTSFKGRNGCRTPSTVKAQKSIRIWWENEMGPAAPLLTTFAQGGFIPREDPSPSTVNLPRSQGRHSPELEAAISSMEPTISLAAADEGTEESVDDNALYWAQEIGLWSENYRQLWKKAPAVWDKINRHLREYQRTQDLPAPYVANWSFPL
ncbi:hypothetical protein E4T56_gene7074 [Termitomyces sp. T112]|nr:hypothetical protein E4T56_gene7074 [Termitomyces sp. T112]